MRITTCTLSPHVGLACACRYGNTLFLVELASPPIQRASGVSGLALDDYCSVNTSLRTLTKCFTAMGSRKKAATPPLRDSRLTHLLSLALGDDKALVHTLVYCPSRRSKRAEAVSALGWASKATAARLKKDVYASASSKAMVSQLQGVVASLEEPSKEMENEMREQMEPSTDAVNQLKAAVAGKKAMLQEVQDEVMAQKLKVEEQLKKNQAEADKRKVEHDEVRANIADIKDQVEGVCSGKKLEQAMQTLRKTIDHQAKMSAGKKRWTMAFRRHAVRKQVEEVRARLETSPSYHALLKEQEEKRIASQG